MQKNKVKDGCSGKMRTRTTEKDSKGKDFTEELCRTYPQLKTDWSTVQKLSLLATQLVALMQCDLDLEEKQKFLNGFNSCTLEAKQFLLGHGVPKPILKNLPPLKTVSNVSDVQTSSEVECQKTSNGSEKRGKILKSRNTTRGSQVKSQKKYEILQKIRQQIFEKQNKKMISNGLRDRDVWRPW